MQFETQRLRLRQWHPTPDARHALDIYGDPQVIRWMDDDSGQDTSMRQAQGRLQRYRDQTISVPGASHRFTSSWAVEQKDIGRAIGQVGLVNLPDLEAAQLHSIEAIESGDGLPTDYVEMNWHFRPASWGFGYASEAALRIAQHAFEDLNLSLLLAISHPQNKRAIALMTRIGMRYDGLTTRRYQGKEQLLYKLSPQDLATAQAKQTSALRHK